jgi:DUF2075 family protein
MIIYSATKYKFAQDVINNVIEKEILASFIRGMGHATGKAEIDSWRNSMLYMNNILADPAIPDDAGVAIEYRIPQASKRIDFIITGLNDENKDTAVLVELKQWSSAELTNMDGIVRTFVGKSVREVSHPSYQVWSYSMLLEDYNSGIQDGEIKIKPCAYLHNYEPDDAIKNVFYKYYTDQAPVFLRDEVSELKDFIKRFIKFGDKNNVIYKIENGRIRPSKQLADSLSSMLAGNHDFVLIDEQKVVYETALRLASEATDEVKNVLIVEGGPGTGKSVVAINLLVELTRQGQVVQYVTKNSAPRSVYEAKLTGRMSKSRISNMFTSSGSFIDLKPNTFDSLIVDEAHRLNAKSGLYGNLGENQIKELISAAKFSVFFIDENQRVTLTDIGEKSEIHKWAKLMGAQVTEMELPSQFRCNGSDGYLAWLDNVLGIHETANSSVGDLDYDFQVLDSPDKLKEMIIAKNDNNKSRLVAGYCWKWLSAKDPNAYDIEIGNFKAQWNLKSDGQSWIIKPHSINEVGCIHTCQGLELDYVGVIIGPDLVIRNGQIVTDAAKRAASDKSVFGYKKLHKENPEQAKTVGDMIIKNTYRTLMTRGMKGCFIYSTDPETQQFFESRSSGTN